MEQVSSHRTDFCEISYLSFHPPPPQILTRITGTLCVYPCTFVIVLRCILPRMRNVADSSYRKNQNTHFISSNFFQKLCLVGNAEKCCWARQVTDQNIIWHLHFASWNTHTHTHTHTRTRTLSLSYSLSLSLSHSRSLHCGESDCGYFCVTTCHNRHAALKGNATRRRMVLLWNHVPGLQCS